MQTDYLWMLISAASGFILGCLPFILYWRFFSASQKKELKKEINRIINQAKSQAMRIERSAEHQAKELERKMKHKADTEARKERKTLEDLKYQAQHQKQKLEADWKQKTEDIEDQIKELDQQKELTKQMQAQLKQDKQKTEETLKELNHKMESTAGWTREQARKEIQHNIATELKQEMTPELMKLEKELKLESEKKAKIILSQALARFAAEVSTERTTTSLPIKESEAKGKIIGREGRNIRALEQACGVDIIIDENQEVILISCFDAVRREIAYKAIHQLLEEGRVHPARIEEIVEKMKRNIFLSMAEKGKQVCFDLSVHNVHPVIMETLGALHYRTIEGHNVLKASEETAHLAGLIAGEIDFNPKLAKRAALFHLIGIGVNHRKEGNIAEVGAAFLKKHGESKQICQAVRCHSANIVSESILDHILQAAYNLFRDRPNARQDMIENYIQRLKDMESVANSFDGIIRSFAIQTGKEIRVLVDSGKVTDEQAFMLSKDIAEKINKEMDASGQIIVSVVRECRVVEQAR